MQIILKRTMMFRGPIVENKAQVKLRVPNSPEPQVVPNWVGQTKEFEMAEDSGIVVEVRKAKGAPELATEVKESTQNKPLLIHPRQNEGIAFLQSRGYTLEASQQIFQNHADQTLAELDRVNAAKAIDQKAGETEEAEADAEIEQEAKEANVPKGQKGNGKK
jgi:hypothetical protein